VSCDANRQAGDGFDGVASVGDITQTDNGGEDASCDANSQAGVNFCPGRRVHDITQTDSGRGSFFPTHRLADLENGFYAGRDANRQACQRI
jgi:hypothetical protein